MTADNVRVFYNNINHFYYRLLVRIVQHQEEDTYVETKKSSTKSFNEFLHDITYPLGGDVVLTEEGYIRWSHKNEEKNQKLNFTFFDSDDIHYTMIGDIEAHGRCTAEQAVNMASALRSNES